MEFLADRTEDDLVIMLISGGGSTLLCLPAAPMIYLDESTLWSELTAKGATIQDINTVRKHISQARGGALAKVAYPQKSFHSSCLMSREMISSSSLLDQR